MTTLSERHKELDEKGEGLCSALVHREGIPGRCDKIAYSSHRGGKYFEKVNGDKCFFNGAYGGYVPALACPLHGGKTKEEAVNLCSNCSKRIADCCANAKFGKDTGKDNVYECDGFSPKPKPKQTATEAKQDVLLKLKELLQKQSFFPVNSDDENALIYQIDSHYLKYVRIYISENKIHADFYMDEEQARRGRCRTTIGAVAPVDYPEIIADSIVSKIMRAGHTSPQTI